MRYFAATSAVALVAVAVLLYGLYRQTAVEGILGSAGDSNAALARSMANAIWPHYSRYATVVANNGVDEAMMRSEFGALHEAIESLTAGLPVLKLVVYDLDGQILYSSDSSEIGAIGADDPEGFEAAMQGSALSGIEFRELIVTLSDDIENRHVVETYMPFASPAGSIVGVFELYTDVSDKMVQTDQKSNLLLAGLLGVFTALYAGLLLVVWRANRILAAQYGALEQSRAESSEKNARLLEEIAHRNQIEADLRKARDQAFAASDAKSRFLANMSHEFRTPLNAIIGFSDMISEQMVGPEQLDRYRNYARDIGASGQHLLALVNDILDLARIEAGKLPVSLDTVPVADLLAELEREMKPQILRNQNEIAIECPEEVGDVVTDGEKLHGILVNLVGNAAKFTSDGQIRIRADREGEGDEGRVCFEVIDNGPGIEQDRIAGLFEDYAQHDNTISREFGGTGLGLAISRRSVEMLGGHIEIESEPGAGTTVRFRLPDGEISDAGDLAAE